jgi:hypothetical protein
MKIRTLGKLTLVFALASIALGTSQLLAGKPGGGGCPTGKPNCVCPQYIDPVVCADGCTYYNSCAATCAGERNCVPTGGGPVQ